MNKILNILESLNDKDFNETDVEVVPLPLPFTPNAAARCLSEAVKIAVSKVQETHYDY